MAVGKSCSLLSLPSPHFHFVFLYLFIFLHSLSSFLSPFSLRGLGLLSASQPTSKARNNLLKCIFVSPKRIPVFFSIFTSPPLFSFTRSKSDEEIRFTFIITIRYHRFKKIVRAIRPFVRSFVRASREARKRIPLMSSATFPVKITLTFLHRT